MPVVTTTSPTQQKQQIPYEQQDQLTPIVKPQASPGGAPAVVGPGGTQQQTSQVQNLAQGNDLVMQTAQQQALAAQNKPNQTMGLVQQGVQGLLKNPLGYDSTKYQQNQLEQYDRNRASAMKAFQQSTADVQNTGVNAERAYNYAMQGAQGRSDLQNQVAMEQAQKQQEAMLAALGAGQSVSQTQSGLDETAFNRLLNTRAQYEGERSQTQANTQEMAVLDKTYGQELAKMVMAQDWQGGQAALDREAAILAQSTDLAAKQAFQDKQNAFDMAKLNATQDWQGAQNKIQNDLALAMQANDINATAANIQKQLDLDKWKQENGQTFTAEQSALNRALETSLASMKITSETTNAALDRELTREVESGRLSVQEKQLAQSASQFGSEMEFKRYALQSGFDENAAARAWQASESALDRSGTKELKQLEVESQKALINLKGQIDNAMLLTTQDFEGEQARLDRMLQISRDTNNATLEKELVNLKGQIDAQAQTAQNNFVETQRIATQAWQTGENIREEDAAKAEQYFDWQQKNLAQANDLEGQKILASMKNQFDLALQTQDMNHDEKMLNLSSMYEEAKANNDVERQRNILEFTYNQDIAKMSAEFGFDQAKITLQGNIEAALKQGDYEHAEAMQQALFTQQSKEAGLDRVIQNAQLALQAKGINLEALDADYKRLEAQVAAGQLNPSVLTDFVSKTLSTNGVIMTPPDPLAAKKEADKEFAALQQEYLRTHPEYMNEVGGLKPDGRIAFNEFINKSLYGEGTTGSEEAISQKATEALSDEDKYKALLSDPAVKEWVPQMSYDSGGFFGADSRSFANAPAKGSIFKYGGKAYEVISDPVMQTKGNDVQYFSVKDLSDGTVKRVSINPAISGNTTATDFITGL